MNLKEKSAKNKGFTLIELLVVLAIITLIFSLILASMSTARKKARDSQRVQDFAQFSKALELYYNQYGMYPCGDSYLGPPDNVYIDSSTNSSCPFLDGEDYPGMSPAPPCSGSHVNTSCGFPEFGIYRDGLYPLFHPKDPLNIYAGGFVYFYTVTLDRQSYLLQAVLETNNKLMQNYGGLCNLRYEYGPGVGNATLLNPTLTFWPCN